MTLNFKGTRVLAATGLALSAALLTVPAHASPVPAQTVGSTAAVVEVDRKAAGKPGMRKAPKSVVKAIQRDLGAKLPTECMRFLVARSDSKWAYYGWKSPTPSGCIPTDGMVVLRKTAGKWDPVPGIGGSGDTCEGMRAAVIGAGGSRAVWRDLTSAVIRSCA